MAIEHYLDKSAHEMLETCLVYDHARSAEKMTDWRCCGIDNAAWKDGPFLSSPKNTVQIDRCHPYIIKSSVEFGTAAHLVLGDTPPGHEIGKVKIPLPSINENESRVESVIAKLAIIEQFELFKIFLLEIDGPYNKKKLKAWSSRISQNVQDNLLEIINRRNELTHESEYVAPTMKEAVQYFNILRQIARICNLKKSL